MNAETSPSLTSLGNDIQGLHNLSQFLRHGRIHPTEQYDASHPPEELVDKTIPTDEICSSGPLLLEGLRSPINERRAALAQLNKIEQLRQAIPELEYDLGTVGHHIEVSGFDSIRHIIRTDKELFIPALGFLYQRAAAKSYESSWELCQHLPALFGPANDKSEAAPRAQLQYDIVRTMAENPHGTLLTSFIDSLGLGMYGFSPAVWEEVGEQPDRRIWAQKNIETMLALERIEPGLCAKLYQQFRTKNFARCKPETWHGMYKARLENPQQPYVMDLVASHDYNFANSHPQNYDTLFKKLQTAGVGYELYECTDATDIQHAQNQATIRLNDHAAHIKNLIIRGHANPLGIQLSKSRWIRASNIDYMSQLEGVLDDDATIFLNACEAGKKMQDDTCIALDIQKKLMRPVDAAEHACGIHISADKMGNIRTRSEKATILGVVVYAGSLSLAAGVIIPSLLIAASKLEGLTDRVHPLIGLICAVAVGLTAGAKAGAVAQKLVQHRSRVIFRNEP